MAERERGGRKREADKVKVAPGVTVGRLRLFRAALIGPTQGFPKWRRLRRYGSLRALRVLWSSRCHASGCKCKVVAIHGGHRMRSRLALYQMKIPNTM